MPASTNLGADRAESPDYATVAFAELFHRVDFAGFDGEATPLVRNA